MKPSFIPSLLILLTAILALAGCGRPVAPPVSITPTDVPGATPVVQATASASSATTPGPGLSYLEHALQLEAANDPAGAEAEYRRGLKQVPASVELHTNLGILLLKRQNYQEAIVELEAARNLNPKNAQVMHNLAIAQQLCGQLDAAMASYRAALALDARNPEILNDLGLLLLARKQFEQAAGKFKSAMDLEGEDQDYHRYNYACALAGMGRKDEALRQLALVLEMKPELRQHACNDPDFWSLKSDIRFQDLIEGEQ